MALAIQFPLGRAVPATPEPAPLDAPAADPLAALRHALDPRSLRDLRTGQDLHRDQNRRLTTLRPTALEPLDALLGGGLRRGTLTELTGWRSAGRLATVLAVLASVTGSGEAAALVDTGDGFDPENGQTAGIDLDRLLWVRPQKIRDAIHCAELVIQTGFPLVVIDFGLRLRGARPYDAAWVRLARAAEHHGAVLLVSSPWPLTGGASEAHINLDRPRGVWTGGGKAPSLLTGIDTTFHLDRHRHRRTGEQTTCRWLAVAAARKC